MDGWGRGTGLRTGWGLAVGEVGVGVAVAGLPTPLRLDEHLRRSGGQSPFSIGPPGFFLHTLIIDESGTGEDLEGTAPAPWNLDTGCGLGSSSLSYTHSVMVV